MRYRIGLRIAGVGNISDSNAFVLVTQKYDADPDYYREVLSKYPSSFKRARPDGLGGLSVTKIDNFMLAGLIGDADLEEVFFLPDARPSGYVTQDMSTSGTTLKFKLLPGVTEPSTPYAVYCGREKMKVTSSTTVDRVVTATVVRGFHGTVAQDHFSGELDDRAVFFNKPFIQTRSVEVFRINDDDDSSTTIGEGFVDLSFTEKDDAEVTLKVAGSMGLMTDSYELGDGRLVLYGTSRVDGTGSVSVSFSGLDDRDTIYFKGFQQPPDIERDEITSLADDLDDDDEVMVVASYAGLSDGDIVYIGAEAIRIDGTPSSVNVDIIRGVGSTVAVDHYDGDGVFDSAWKAPRDYIVMDFGEFIAPVGINQQGQGRRGILDTGAVRLQNMSIRPEILFGSAQPGSGDDQSNFSAKEVITTYPGWSWFVDENGDESDHFIDVLLALMVSTGTVRRYYQGDSLQWFEGDNGVHDCLPRQWGLGILADKIDLNSFYRVKYSDKYSRLTLGNFVLGAGNSNLKARDVISEICKQCCVSITEDGSGKLRIDPTFSTRPYSAVLDDDSIVSIKRAQKRKRPYSAITLKTCKAWPSGDLKHPIHALDMSGSFEQRLVRYTKSLSVDAPYIGTSSGALPHKTKRALTALISQAYRNLNSSPTEFMIETTVLEGVFRVNETILVSSSEVFDHIRGIMGLNSHEMRVKEVSESTDTGKVSLVVEDLRDLYGDTKRLSPAWRVRGVVSSTQVSLEENAFTGQYVNDDGDFNEKDLIEIGSNYKYSLYSPLGEKISTLSPYILSITGGGEYVFSGTFGVIPSVGDIIRLASYDDTGLWKNTRSFVADSGYSLGVAGIAKDTWGA